VQGEGESEDEAGSRVGMLRYVSGDAQSRAAGRQQAPHFEAGNLRHAVWQGVGAARGDLFSIAAANR
jgi:hypothetical protein